MSMLSLEVPFVAGQVQPSAGGGGNNLPVGKHKVSIAKFDQKANKAGTGGYLEITAVCTEGEHAGCSAVDRLSIFHSNPTTVRIAMQRLSAYCHVLGRPDWNSSVNALEELVNIPFYIEVEAQRDNPQYTEITGIFDVNGNLPGQQGASAPAPTAAPAPTGNPNLSWGAPTAAPTAAPVAAPAAEVAAAPTAWASPAPAPHPAATAQPANSVPWAAK